MPNIRLLKYTLGHVETHLPLWNQQRWVTAAECGTAYCYAGHAVVQAGIPVDPVEQEVPAAALRDRGFTIHRDIRSVSIAAAAEMLLDITDTELTDRETGEIYSAAEILFDGNNTLNDLRYYVAQLCAETAPGGA